MSKKYNTDPDAAAARDAYRSSRAKKVTADKSAKKPVSPHATRVPPTGGATVRPEFGGRTTCCEEWLCGVMPGMLEIAQAW